MLGGLRAISAERVIERFPTQKTAALLAQLAFYPAQRHAREQLIDVLWPEADLAAGRDRLSQSLVWLRRQLEPDETHRGTILMADRVSVGLNSAAITTDTADFADALAAAKNPSNTDRATFAALESAVECYAGELLPGYYSDWILHERQRLLNSYLLALHQLATILEASGDYTKSLDYAQRALRVDPLLEEAHCDIIRILAATGRTAAALKQFQELELLLQRELNSEPSRESRDLIDRVRHGAFLIPQETPRKILLPAPLTRFFGRESEIEHVQHLIGSKARLITLVGIGGSGKTRLAIALASRFVDADRVTAAFVPLADLTDAQMIPAAIADSMRLPSSAALPAKRQIIDALSERPLLLILDGLEHLIADAGPLLRELLAQLPLLTILATSRRSLGISGEQEVTVPPLPLASPDAAAELIRTAPSVRLFVDRAQSTSPQFSITQSNAALIAQVCARLDGIPLAIELCAAWIQVLTPSQILDKLAHRFDLLVSRRTDIPKRHRSLRAALEYTYLQLPSELQRLFVRLSVFRGGWTLEAAEAVCSDAQDGSQLGLMGCLAELRERSLIVTEEYGESESESEMRYRVLDTLREFASEQLTYADRAERRRAHALYFLELAEAAEAGMAGSEQKQRLAHLAREQENLRAALTWSLEDGQTALGLRLAAALRSFWLIRGPLDEGRGWLRQLLDSATSNPKHVESIPVQVFGNAWSVLGQIAWAQGDYPAADEAHQRALALRRTTGHAIAESLYHLGITAYRLDDYNAARTHLAESLAISENRGDKAGIARVLLNLGNIAYEEQNHSEAESYFQKSLALEREIGNQQRVGNVLNNLALTAIAKKDYEGAEALLRDALSIRRELIDHYGAASVLMSMGVAARFRGDAERANAVLTEGLALAQQVGDKHITAFYLMEFGLLASMAKNHRDAVPLLAASQKLFKAMGSSAGSASAESFQSAVDNAVAALQEAEFSALWQRGESAAPEQIITEILKK